jgi:hypothetical protein
MLLNLALLAGRLEERGGSSPILEFD